MNLTCGSGLVARGRDDTARAGRVRGGRKALACGGMGRTRRLGRVGGTAGVGRCGERAGPMREKDGLGCWGSRAGFG